jgi:hypothetical protein
LASDQTTSVIPNSPARNRGKFILQRSLGVDITLDAEAAGGLASDQNTSVVPETQARDPGKVIIQRSLGVNVTLDAGAAGRLASDQTTSANLESPVRYRRNVMMQRSLRFMSPSMLNLSVDRLAAKIPALSRSVKPVTAGK